MKNEITQEYILEKDQGSMFLLNSAPKGYKVCNINREETKAVVTYIKEDV